MIMKEVRIPFKMLQLLALKRRLPPIHPKLQFIDRDYKKLKAGYKGEQEMAYQLRYLDPEKYFIFHDLRLKINNTYFQVDFLLLSLCFHTIMEVKNIGGTLYFDPVFDQLIRKRSDGHEVGFPDPTFQVKRQQLQFIKWLEQKNLPIAPIQYLIGIGDSKTILKTSLNNHDISKWIVHKWAAAFKIASFEKIHSQAKLSLTDLKKISRKLIKGHHPHIPNILDQYNINREELILGVECNICRTFSMKKHNAKWVCISCGNTSKDAHLSAIADYGLLINTTFSNHQIKEFLRLPTWYATTYLLNKINIDRIGKRYIISSEILYHLAKKDEFVSGD